MGSETEGQAAMQGLNNKEVEGRAMSVSIAKEKTERSNSGGGSNRRW
jgi:RNA recognition motif-containing protein